MLHDPIVPVHDLNPGDLIVLAGDPCVRVLVTGATLTVLADGDVIPGIPAIGGVTRMGSDALPDLSIDDLEKIVGLRGWTDELARVWQEVETTDPEAFAAAVEILVEHDDVRWCECADPVWLDDSRRTSGGETLCEGCYEDNYFTCVRCGDVESDDNGTSMDDGTYCDSCRGRYLHWCDECDEYAYDADPHDHRDPQCECEAPLVEFSLGTTGTPLRHDDRIDVTLPAGVISEVGMGDIYRLVLNALRPTLEAAGTLYTVDLYGTVMGVEPVWQGKRGNFTKRLAATLHKDLGLKLPPAVISEVGNLARQHASNVAEYDIEVTRYLNGDAEDFYHEESCWWTSESQSRCALKAWGGMGLRTFGSHGCVTGRAWVQPLRFDEDGEEGENLVPTHNTTDPVAYVVYNGYGVLEGYVGARILAQLTGRSYKKVTLSVSGQYVNNSTGYLVAEQAVCEDVEGVDFGSYSTLHATGDAHQVRNARSSIDTQEVVA